jgi:hypothetical protein
MPHVGADRGCPLGIAAVLFARSRELDIDKETRVE